MAEEQNHSLLDFSVLPTPPPASDSVRMMPMFQEQKQATIDAAASQETFSSHDLERSDIEPLGHQMTQSGVKHYTYSGLMG
jgi:hypothetical protein